VTSPEKPEASAAPDGKTVETSTVITDQAKAAEGAQDTNAEQTVNISKEAAASVAASAAGPHARPDAPTVQQPRPKLDGAPPPWQRVASDTSATTATPPATGDRPESGSRFADWGYASGAGETYSSDGQAAGTTVNTPLTGPDAARTHVSMATGATPSAGRPAAPNALRRPGRGPRRASLQVKRVDPWSVLKLAFVLSVALFFVWLVAVGVLYGVLDGMGVWDKLNGTYSDFAQNSAAGGSGPLITVTRIFSVAAVIGAINIVLFTALATVGAFVYNVSADLAGGLEVTLAERE
jgi:hypothetical protein